jgi:hypothetical protein
VVNAFEMKVRWAREVAGDGGDSTFCSLKIEVASKNITAYKIAREEFDHIQLPVYYLAEWVAENWWPLIWEPRKSEDFSQSEGFASRHNILSAQNGFALPSLSFTSTGDNIDIYSAARTAEYAGARFFNVASSTLPRKDVETELMKFVSATVDKLGGRPNGVSPLETAWQRILDTGDDERTFCALIGSLGLSPYEMHPEIERALDKVSEVLKEHQLFDLCRVSTPDTFIASAALAHQIGGALHRAAEIDLSRLIRIPVPSERPALPAYHSGYEAARKLRAHFEIKENDLDGAGKIFRQLNIDPKLRNYDAQSGAEEDPPIVAATARDQDRGKLVITPEISAQRRFAAARGAYFFWTAGSHEECLITDAVTRDQQASRAFAAEILLPKSYVRSIAKNHKISGQAIFDLAEREDVSPRLIRWQAHNDGISVS